jgi:hypothetical protein
MTKPWEENKAAIITQYRDLKKPLHEVKKFMEKEYDFKASYVLLLSHQLLAPQNPDNFAVD